MDQLKYQKTNFITYLMYNDLRKSFLELTVVWKDDNMIELKVKTSNSRFSGITEVYDTSDTLIDFAKKLIGFPADNKTLFYEAGEKDSYSYFSMHFYCIDTIGHIGVEINLEENVSTVYRNEEKDKLKLEIIVVPSAIDNLRWYNKSLQFFFVRFVSQNDQLNYQKTKHMI